jgi:site-specific recombinase XerD
MGRIVDTTLFGLIHDYFKSYLPHHRRCSHNTIRSYRTAMEAFLNFTKEQRGISLSAVTFKMLDSKMLISFLDSLELNGCGISTRNQRLNCIRAFFVYAAQVDTTTVIHKSDIFKVPIKKLSKPNIVKHMNEKAISTLLEQPNPFTKKGQRDRFMLLLLYDTAARCQELLDFRLCDIRLGKAPVITIQHGKGDKARDVPLMKKTVEHFQNYRQIFHSGESDYSDCPLFYMMRDGEKKPLENSTIRKLIISYGLEARKHCADIPEHITTHTLRHSRAMHLYQHGMDLTLVTQWVGHTQLETTLIYAHADTELKRKSIEVATPADNPLKKRLNADRFIVTDDDTLKSLYGLTE